MEPERKIVIYSSVRKVISVPFLMLFYLAVLNGQTQWAKYSNNPVLTKGPSDWDIIAIGQPTVLFENDTIKMWYIGVGSDMKGRVCYAASADGINGIKYSNPVVDVGAQGEWDCGWLDTPEIVKDEDGYDLYYYGDTAQQFAAISSAIGLAHSSDGIHWIKDVNNPVFTKGDVGEWDGTWVESPAVLYDSVSGEYRMWYNGVDTSTWKIHIGLATSSDGISWARYAGNPVISAGDWGQYDDMWAGTPAVIYQNGKHEMWYSSTGSLSYNPITEQFDTIGICYATSDDGIEWTKHPDNPLFDTHTLPYDSLIDSGGPWAPDVIFNATTNSYLMWFETFEGFLLATAPETNTGLKDYAPSTNALTVFPNPVSSLTIIRTCETLQNALLIIRNSSGQIVELKTKISGNEIQVERGSLSGGIYLLQLIDNKRIYTGKLIVE